MKMMIEAKRVVGSTIEVDKDAFQNILSLKNSGIVVIAKTGFFTKYYQYQTSYMGYTFYLQVKDSFPLPDKFTLVKAEKISSPTTMVTH